MNRLRTLRQGVSWQQILPAPVVAMTFLIGLASAQPSSREENASVEKIPSELGDYVGRPDPTFAWEIKR